MARWSTLLAVAIVAGFLNMLRSDAQSPSRVEFEVATIRLNADCANGGGHEQLSPGRFGVECVSLRDYIRGAYGAFGKGHNPNARTPDVLGGPAWMDSDRYDIIAKAPADTGLDEMYGPMMRALLEDRFQLKVHSESRELPVYTLTVAKGGGTKLTPAAEGSCVLIDLSHVLQSPPSQPNYCGRVTTKQGVSRTFDGYGVTLAEFIARAFRDALDRPVIDKTGLTGRFEIHLEFVPENARLEARDGQASAPGGGGPSIFTALQDQLGLKLSPDKGPVEVIVVDRAEKPSAN